MLISCTSGGLHFSTTAVQTQTSPVRYAPVLGSNFGENVLHQRDWNKYF